MKTIMLEDIDSITNDLMDHVRSIVLKVKTTESDVDDEIYSAIHNQLKESLDPWRETKEDLIGELKKLDDNFKKLSQAEHERREEIQELLDLDKETPDSNINIQVQRIYRFDTDRPLKAFTDIIVNDCLLIKGVKVVKGDHGLYITMPQEQAKDKKWHDVIRCLTKEIRDKITEKVLEVYKEGIICP